jgi:hypothetical protein
MAQQHMNAPIAITALFSGQLDNALLKRCTVLPFAPVSI